MIDKKQLEKKSFLSLFDLNINNLDIEIYTLIFTLSFKNSYF